MFKKVVSLFIVVCTVLALGASSMAAAPENPEAEMPSLYTAEQLGFDEDTVFTDEEAQQLAKEISKRYVEESGFSSESDSRLRNSASGLHGTAAIYHQGGGSLYWGTSLKSGGVYNLIATITVYKDNRYIGSYSVGGLSIGGSLDGSRSVVTYGKGQYKACFEGGFYGANGNGLFIGSIASGCQTAWTM